MVRYLAEVLGIRYLYLAGKPATDSVGFEGPVINSGDWVWLGPELESASIFGNMIKALAEHLSKQKFQGQMILIDQPYSEILKADFEWPEELVFVCYDKEFYQLFSQVLSKGSRMIWIPDPNRYQNEPNLKKQAWQALTQGS